MGVENNNPSLWIIDSTLRERSSMNGREYSEQDKRKIARLLSLGGVDEIEAGIPALGARECRAIRQIKVENPNTLVTCWVKSSMASLELARRCAVRSIHICFSQDAVGSGVPRDLFERNLDDMDRMIKACYGSFDSVSVGIPNSFDADQTRLLRFITRAEESGIFRIRLADERASAVPGEVRRFFERLKPRTGMSLEFHGHNAAGRGLENTVQAINGGADAVSLTLRGVGSNGGVTSLEETGPVLLRAFQYTSLNFYKLKEAARYVSILENRRKPRKRIRAA